MDKDTDILKLKIEQAKKLLPQETREAISAVDWKKSILGMRNTHGYSFEQLGDLELVTELVFCGLTPPKEYPLELEKRMHISKEQALEIVNEMNILVFKKIREELIKRTEQNKISIKNIANTKKQEDIDRGILDKAGIQIISTNTAKSTEKPDFSLPELNSGQTKDVDEKLLTSNSILAQKLSKPVQTEKVKTDYTIEKIQPTVRKLDPYREIPE